MNIASGLIISSLFRKVRDSVIFDFKDKFWGKVKRENIADSPTAEFRATKLVKVWDKTLQCGVLLEIEPLIADPRPTEFQKAFFLHITENLDALFSQSIRTLHIHFGEVKEYVTKYRRQMYPRLFIIPLSAETEWCIYFQTLEGNTFILDFKGDTFLRAKNTPTDGGKVTSAIV